MTFWALLFDTCDTKLSRLLSLKKWRRKTKKFDLSNTLLWFNYLLSVKCYFFSWHLKRPIKTQTEIESSDLKCNLIVGWFLYAIDYIVASTSIKHGYCRNIFMEISSFLTHNVFDRLWLIYYVANSNDTSIELIQRIFFIRKNVLLQHQMQFKLTKVCRLYGSVVILSLLCIIICGCENVVKLFPIFSNNSSFRVLIIMNQRDVSIGLCSIVSIIC